LAGWTEPTQTLSGDFYDWFCLPDGWLTIAVGNAAGQDLAAALISSNLKTALRSHAQYYREADRLLRQLNLTLWTGSAGDQAASLFCGLVETSSGRISYAAAGEPSVLLFDSTGWQSLTRPSPRLGEGPETPFDPFGCELSPGQTLVVLGDGLCKAHDSSGRVLCEADLAAPILTKASLPAKGIVAFIRDQFAADITSTSRAGGTILVVKRTVP
jgi:sigma-B regulation protein RsbU (phosphoserine phosphatase)